MKIISLQENLKQGFFAVGRIASKNSTLPILSNVLIKAEKGNIKFITTNLEIGIVSSIRGKIEMEGSFTVDSKIIADYIALLPNKKVSLELKEKDLIINSENYKTKIKGQSAEEFPLIPDVEKDICYSADAVEFKKALSNVIFAVSTSESRLELSGVLFCFNKESLIMAATDSFRLAEKKIKLKKYNDCDKKIIIPAKTLQELLRIISGGAEIMDNEEKEIKFYISDNQVLFTYGSTELISRLIEGQYPDYEQIIPISRKTTSRINRSEFIRAVKAASLFSKIGINDINIDFPINKNKAVISAISGQTGENISEVEANVEGSDNSIVMNYKYLLDGLNNMDCEQVDMDVIDNNTPCIIKPENSKDYTYIIMPIKQ